VIRIAKALGLGGLLATAGVVWFPGAPGTGEPGAQTPVERAADAGVRARTVGESAAGSASRRVEASSSGQTAAGETLPEALESSLFVIETFFPEPSARTLEDLARACDRRGAGAAESSARAVQLDRLALAWSQGREEDRQ